TDYYRRLLDGRLSDEDRPDIEADLQAVFSRPWTRLFVQSHKDKEVADRDTVGHRGTPIGRVDAVVGNGTAAPRLRFCTCRALERHDGLQVDLPTLGKPFGFAVERLWIIKKNKREETFAAQANTVVEASLPREHPDLPAGAPVYCSSSQEVKQKYRHDRPRPGQFHQRRPLDVDVVLATDQLTPTGRGHSLAVRRSLPGPFEPARDAKAMEGAVRTTFEKLGATRLQPGTLTFHNEANRFVPVSRLNQLRRDLVEGVEKALRDRHEKQVSVLQAAVAPP